jgi:hypothetical protein
MKRKQPKIRRAGKPPHIYTALEKELMAERDQWKESCIYVEEKAERDLVTEWRKADGLREHHREQQEIALGTILALLAESGDAEKLRASVEGWKCRCLSHVQRMADLQRQCGESDKALESYVASFDAHRTQTDAMMDALCKSLESVIGKYIRERSFIDSLTRQNDITWNRVGDLDLLLEKEKLEHSAHRTQTDAMMDMLCRALEGAERLYIRDEQLIAYRNGIRLALREIMDCARDGKFSPADWKRLVEAAG